ncbi:MAG: response regulator transcription factor [Gammaproteobacteria bacterium]|nr:response regulator transcription factor [Gammaproteobacteria bacterium]
MFPSILLEHEPAWQRFREKTVRNHASNLFDKLGVWSRAQAIVFARDRGFSP